MNAEACIRYELQIMPDDSRVTVFSKNFEKGR